MDICDRRLRACVSSRKVRRAASQTVTSSDATSILGNLMLGRACPSIRFRSRPNQC